MKRWPLNKAHFWESAPFFRILLPFAAGILFYDTVKSGSFPGFSLLLCIVLLFLLYTGIIFFNKNKRPLPIAVSLLLHLLLFAGGVLVAGCNDVRNDKAWFGNNINPESACLVRINDLPAEKENSWKVPVTVLTIFMNGKLSNVKGNALLYIYKDLLPMTLRKGDTIITPGNWTPITNAGNPFEFDYAGYCRRNNLVYQQLCAMNDVRLFGAVDPAKSPLIDRSHDWCIDQLHTYLPDEKSRGLIQAMLLGDEVYLDEDLRQSYSETGIIHIIAISGGNVAIFFLVISWLLWWLKNKKHLWIKFALALPLVWFYVLMAGAPPSAIRAAIMFSLLAFSVILQKNNNSLNQLFATAFILLCAEPMWLFSVGFQLSFVAVLSLILFYAPVYKWFTPSNKIAKLLWSTIVASVAAEILVAPLVIYYFHNFPLLFIVANVLAYVFMSLVLIAGITIIAFSSIPVFAKALGLGTTFVVTVFDDIVSKLQGLNPSSFHFLLLSGLELTLIYVVLAAIVLFLLKKQKQALFTGLAAACLLAASFCADKWTQISQQQFIVYNVSGTNYMELIHGAHYRLLTIDSAARKKIEYATHPDHTYLRAWKKDSTAIRDAFYIHGKSVLILNDDIATGSQFHVDYLVVNFTDKVDPLKLQKIFSPHQMILGNNIGRKQQNRLKTLCENNGINIHAVANNGAFVLR